MTEPEHEDKDQLWSEATLWFARMRSPDAEAFRPEFEEWLARGALHRGYYNRASEHWIHSTAAYPEHQAQANGRPEVSSVPPRRMGQKRGAVVASVAALVLVAASTTFLATHHRGDDNPPSRPVAATETPSAASQYATAAGEQRRIGLADGSVILLGSETVLRVRFGNALRRLELERGSARFEVAHEMRPFVVLAGGGSITAHGTMFDIGVTPDRHVSVRLIRGSVDVRFPPAVKPSAEPQPKRLHPGETVTFVAAQAADQPSASPLPTQADAARDYRNVRIADIVSEANRIARVPIRFADSSIGAQMVSGRFRTDDTNLLAERLATLFDLAVDRSRGSEILLRSR